MQVASRTISPDYFYIIPILFFAQAVFILTYAERHSGSVQELLAFITYVSFQIYLTVMTTSYVIKH